MAASVDDVLRAIARCIREVGRCLSQSLPDIGNLQRKIVNAKRNNERIKDHIGESEYSSLEKSLDDLSQLVMQQGFNGQPHIDHQFDDQVAPVSESDEMQTGESDEMQTGDEEGRPTLKISFEELQLLFDNGYTASKIGDHLNCSASFVYKELSKYGLSMRRRYSTISDSDLDSLVTDLHQRHKNAGVEMMNGYLLAAGHRVQRRKVRASLNRIDPVSCASRWSRSVSRRVYKVPVPNSLWHIDGYMRLVRWRFAIHGCVDGYSRLIPYIRCATNNMSTTVLTTFVQGVCKYGLPSMVRSDYGGENTKVALFMNLVGGGSRRHLAGESVHNQRIERLWKDVFTQVAEQFYNLFYSFEDRGLLSLDNDWHLICLQLIYLPVINRHLSEFQEAWNKHRVRTENNRTPEQIWLDGSLSNSSSSHLSMQYISGRQPSVEDSLQNLLLQFGLSRADIADDQDAVNAVIVPTLSIEVTDDQHEALLNLISDQVSDEDKYTLAIRSRDIILL